MANKQCGSGEGNGQIASLLDNVVVIDCCGSKKEKVAAGYGEKGGEGVKIIHHSSLHHFKYKGTSRQIKIMMKSGREHLSWVGQAHFNGRRQYKCSRWQWGYSFCC